MTEQSLELTKIRKKIDKVDQQIQDLINQRAQLALMVAKTKQQSATTPVYYRPERELSLFNKLIARNEGPLADKEIQRIFSCIVSACRAIQQQLNVAFLGPEGTFSHMALIEKFGHSVMAMPRTTIADVVRAVEVEQAHYGLIPIENSTTGLINLGLDAISQTKLQICGEVNVAIQQNLMQNPQFDQPIQRIYAHQQSLLQCQRWLQQHYPEIETIAVSSNAKAAQLAQQQAGTAAIAGKLCARYYHLSIKHQNIEDNADNQTRFLILGQQLPEATGTDKTALLVSTGNKPGTLTHVIGPFAARNVNITVIESRPARNPMWKYTFYLELDGHQHDAVLAEALAEIQRSPVVLTILGSFPKA